MEDTQWNSISRPLLLVVVQLHVTEFQAESGTNNGIRCGRGTEGCFSVGVDDCKECVLFKQVGSSSL